NRRRYVRSFYDCRSTLNLGPFGNGAGTGFEGAVVDKVSRCGLIDVETNSRPVIGVEAVFIAVGIYDIGRSREAVVVYSDVGRGAVINRGNDQEALSTLKNTIV